MYKNLTPRFEILLWKTVDIDSQTSLTIYDTIIYNSKLFRMTQKF